MWTQLQQLRIEVGLGLAFCLVHSLVAYALYKASLNNIELGVLWEHMRLTDLPVSLLLDKFVDATWNTDQDTYHKSYFRFHLVFGGLQFFIWGWVLGAIATICLKRRCPAKRCE